MIKHVAIIAIAQSNVDEKGSTETRRQRILGREALSPRMASTYLRPGLRSLMISRKMGEQKKKEGLPQVAVVPEIQFRGGGCSCFR